MKSRQIEPGQWIVEDAGGRQIAGPFEFKTLAELYIIVNAARRPHVG